MKFMGVAEAHAAAHTMRMAWRSMTCAYSSGAAAVTLLWLLGAASGAWKLPGHVFPLPKDKKALSSFLTGHAQVKIHEKGMDNECSPLLLAR